MRRSASERWRALTRLLHQGQVFDDGRGLIGNDIQKTHLFT